MEPETQKRKQRQLPSAEEFNEKTAAIIAGLDDIVTLGAVIARNNGSVTIDGETVNQQTFKSYKAAVKRELEDVNKDFNLSLRTGKSKKGRAAGEEEKKKRQVNLSLFSDAFSEFWKNAKLGPVNPFQPQEEGSLKDHLGILIDEGIGSTPMMGSLWSTYIDANKQDMKTNDKTYFKATPDMERYLGPALDWLEEEGNTPTESQIANYNKKMREYNQRLADYQEARAEYNRAVDRYNEIDAQNVRNAALGVKRIANSKPKKPTEPKPPVLSEPFDRNRFRRTYLTIINSLYTVARDLGRLTPKQQAGKIAVGNSVPATNEQLDLLNSQEVKDDVEETLAVLKRTRDLYNQLNKTGKYAPSKSKSKAKQEEEEFEEEGEEEEFEEEGEEEGEEEEEEF